MTIVYEINENFNISNYPTLEICLFGVIKFIKDVNIDIAKYKFFGYGVGFD